VSGRVTALLWLTRDLRVHDHPEWCEGRTGFLLVDAPCVDSREPIVDQGEAREAAIARFVQESR
jgi:deoxyribodipyrimidine photolyase